MNNQPENNQTEKKSVKTKIINTVVNVVFVAVMLFGIFCSYTAFVTKRGDGVPSVFGICFFPIQSDSMSPTFDKGDLIFDKVVKDPTKLNEGDVITFWTNINAETVLNTHRIVEKKDYGNFIGYVTKGDNPDAPIDRLEVHQNKIEGEYLFRIPKLGSFIDFLQTGNGFLIVIVLPVALFFIWQLVSFFRSLFAYNAEKMRIQLRAEMEANRAANPQQNGVSPTESQPTAPPKQDDADNK